MINFNDLKILEYAIDDRTSIVNRRNKEGLPDRWAIVYGHHSTLNKKMLEFDYEQLPSSRTDKYLKQHRFKSASEALSCYNKYLKKQK